MNTQRQITQGISLITAVKNRAESLRQALASWICFDEISEIIIVDWNSDVSLQPLVETFSDRRIRLFTVTEQPQWILSQAYNLAARLASHTRILKADADIKVLPGFFSRHMLLPGTFFCGNWRLRRNDNELHLNGVTFLWREDFFRVNGYNEFIKVYGWDDSDLYERLQEFKLIRKDLDPDTLYHIPHSGRVKFQNKPDYFRCIPDEEFTSLATLINRHLARTAGKWGTDRKMATFEVLDDGWNSGSCRKTGEEPCVISPESLKTSETVALRERLQQIGQGFDEKALESVNRDDLLSIYQAYLAVGSNPEIRKQFIRRFNSGEDIENIAQQ
ncbi:MAG TPA: galactosyltransferase-related protein [Bacteroidales bacterium]|nr:galactosyltransferase-related protein [Bacteroidales bacterium]HPS51750.1 galactosyltransferase-related protein [Bacteroidales bacterium]